MITKENCIAPPTPFLKRRVVMGHNHDLLLALTLVDRLGREWPSVQRLVAEFCAATEAKMSLERLREIESQLVRSRQTYCKQL